MRSYQSYLLCRGWSKSGAFSNDGEVKSK
ncbi:hypothetical protein NC651_021876 [Populus alba x Populus x berolinensis]|nr:hypothetical protein NC651_021876 [Populus alba x Populus x berolinensis]